MTLKEFLEAASALNERASALISGAATGAQLEAARNQLLGRKSGELGAIMKALPELPVEERKAAGAAVNTAKFSIEEALAELKKAHADKNIPAIDSGITKLQGVVQGMYEAMKGAEGTGDGAQQNANPGAAQNDGKDTNVTDVDYEEVKEEDKK